MKNYGLFSPLVIIVTSDAFFDTTSSRLMTLVIILFAYKLSQPHIVKGCRMIYVVSDVQVIKIRRESVSVLLIGP